MLSLQDALPPPEVTHSRLMMNWIAIAQRTNSSVGVVMG
jgi:hypothetical protein